jgi:ribosome maturation factor RimP
LSGRIGASKVLSGSSVKGSQKGKAGSTGGGGIQAEARRSRAGASAGGRAAGGEKPAVKPGVKPGFKAAGKPLRPPRLAPRPLVPEGPRLGWREAIAATVTGLGFVLVDVERAQRGLLRVTIDREPGRNYAVPGEFVLVDDCEQVTRQLQYALEVEGLAYARLEVSSPGLDRPLKTAADFERFVGSAISLTLKLPFQGRKAWQGILGRGEDAAAWSLAFKVGAVEQALGFTLDEVREARLVPVVDFKGRKSKDSGPSVAAGDAAPGTDGG